MSVPELSCCWILVTSLGGHTADGSRFPHKALGSDPQSASLQLVFPGCLFSHSVPHMAICGQFAGLLYYLLLELCMMCLSEGTFLFLCVNFCFPVLCHLWSTLLPHGPQEEKSHKCTPEAVLSSPQLWGQSAPLFPCWSIIKPQAS